MSGIRLSSAAPRSCSPPLGLQRTSDSSFNVYRACVGNAAGNATQISNFADGATVIDGVHNARLSPDGRKILFQVLAASGGNEEIWVVSSTPGSTATQLLADVSDSFYHASWASDSDTFVYVQGTGSGLPTGGAIKKDQVSAIGSPTTLKTAAAGFSVYRPQFNYDDSLVAYWYQQTVGSDALRCMNADGTGDAAVDTGVGNYDNNNPQQFGWARTQNLIAYDAGANAYIIASDGTGRVQINANGPAAGVPMNVTADCWAAGDAFVVTTGTSGFLFLGLYRCETDGSNTTLLNASHGSSNQTWMRGAYVYDNRIWFIETASDVGGGKVSSVAMDGSDYVNNLNVLDDTVLEIVSGGDGFVWN